MSVDHREKLASIRKFPQLIAYLRDEMDWPIEQDSFDNVDDLFFKFTPDELGIDPKNAAKIQEIRRLRPLSTKQPWGIFFVKFEPKKLPVVALRRLLSQVALKKRASSNDADRAAWSANDLLFISNYGEGDSRQISFAHFSQNEKKNDLPTLKVLGWDNLDTDLHLDHVAENLTERLAWPENEDDADLWGNKWRSAFTLGHREAIDTSKKLSVELAHLARNIRDRINTVLAIETDDGPVTKLMCAFKEALVHDLDEDGFADMYAQTIAYGLLSSRIANPSGDNADELPAAMPITSPFLKELMETFLHVGGRNGKAGKGPGLDFDELGVSDVIELLDEANMEAVVRDFGDKNPQEDPVIHFYELFLKEYDAKKRMSRGVFYTPRPVVSFIVRSVDELLRTEFGLADGLSDTTTWGEIADRIENLQIPEGTSPEQAFVQILDPATGTGTFLVETIHIIHQTMTEKWKEEGKGKKKIKELWNEYVPKHLLPRLHGYELMMAPYAIAHMKIGLKLLETGYNFESGERARVYLTNALELAHDFSETLEFAIPALAHEANAVNAIKRNQRFTVIIGNPPYSISSKNNNNWITTLTNKYKIEVKKEKNIQPLSDDYVKFFAFYQHLLQISTNGVLGVITNSMFSKGLVHRGMRSSLLSAFNRMYLVDLHGAIGIHQNDKNVFDITRGVAISLCTTKCHSNSPCSVFHNELIGSRVFKYESLKKNSLSKLDWVRLQPKPPKNNLYPTDNENETEYAAFLSLQSAFQEYGVAVSTRRDHFLVGFDVEQVQERLDIFAGDLPDEEIGRQLGVISTPHWSLPSARHCVREIAPVRNFILPYSYKPFDTRFVYYNPAIIERGDAKYSLMKHMLHPNLSFITTRQTKDSFSCFVTRNISAHKYITTNDRCYAFPLFQYAEEALGDWGRKSSNFQSTFIKSLGISDLQDETQTTMQSNPESTLAYIYAILFSPQYRVRYREMLRNDFPRVPIPESKIMSTAIMQLGFDLMALHLIEFDSPYASWNQPNSSISNPLATPIAVFHETADREVRRVGEKSKAMAKSLMGHDFGRVYINDTAYFDGVPEKVWNFQIGGYQVCHKWLKDRQAKGGKNARPGRKLTQDDINHYQKMVVSISETIRIMAEIDQVIDAHGGWPDAFVMNSNQEKTS